MLASWPLHALTRRDMRRQFALTADGSSECQPCRQLRGSPRVRQTLIVLADVRVGAVVQLADRRKPVVREDESQLAADFAVAGLARLPAGAAHGPDDRVDLLDDVLDDRRGLVRRRTPGGSG